jgi:large subunit ribosomal protein L2
LIRFAKKFTILNNVFVNNKYSYASSNGTFCQINENYEDLGLALVSLPSGKEKMIASYIFSSLGKCYNEDYNLTNPGKAGNLKIRGLKSRVRGVAKNPVDHPHGGRTKTNKPEVSPWGWIAKKNK